MTSKLASEDFERAIVKAFWRKIATWLTGQSNRLLPFDEVRAKMPMQGQRYVGLQSVPIGHIIGSIGRYLDFDRAFLPTQARTKGRWVSIDRAHYEQVSLPPVELIKMGEAYFVKDGNHRVSVARERGQEFIDAYVTKIDIPVPLTPDTEVDDLALKAAYARFLDQTGLRRSRPEANFETGNPTQYEQLLEHIKFHRWLLGEKRQADLLLEDAAVSWYDTVYQPLVQAVREQGLLKDFPRASETDLYLWIVKYLWHLRAAYRDESAVEEDGAQHARQEAARHLIEEDAQPIVRRLINVLGSGDWVDQIVIQRGQADFATQTQLDVLRPGAQITISVPGGYDRLLEHIDVHRWYLGEHRQAEVPYDEAVTSWYDHVYLPLVEIIREQKVLEQFPGRSEADLYLWLVEKRADVRDMYAEKVSTEQAAHQLGDLPGEDENGGKKNAA